MEKPLPRGWGHFVLINNRWGFGFAFFGTNTSLNV
jgi:hypothetical protein